MSMSEQIMVCTRCGQSPTTCLCLDTETFEELMVPDTVVYAELGYHGSEDAIVRLMGAWEFGQSYG